MDRWQLIKRLMQGVVRRRKRLAVAVFVGGVLVLCPVAFFASKEPPRYRTTAVILLESRPDKIPVFQEFAPFRPLGVQLAILRSRSLAESVLESLPKTALNDLLERRYHVDYFAALQNAYQRFRGLEPQVESPMRQALTELQRARVRFDASRSGEGIVEISAEASRPQVAVDIANTYIEVLLARTRTFNVDDTRTSREFLEQQLAEVKRTLKSSEDALRSFNAAHGGVKVPERSQATVTQLSQTESALAEIESSRRMLQTRLQALREKAEAQRRQPAAAVRSTPAAPAPVSADIQRLRAQLTQLETALLDLRTKFTEEHPRVLLVKDRIAEVQRQLGDAVRESAPAVQASPAVPPAERVNFAEQVVALETAMHSITAQEDALRTQAGGLRQSLTGLSRSEQDYTRLVREVESNRHLHALLSDKLTAARMREQGEMKVVKVIDPPGSPAAIAGEKRFQALGLAFALALVIGAGVPAGLEWIQRTVETEDDVEGLGLPVLAVLPRLRTRPRFLSTAETHRLKQVDENFMYSEALRNLRVTIQLTHRTEPPRSILVASGFAGEGKSTLVLNLGMAFGEAGYRVVLADTDFQRPTLHRVLKVAPSAPGLSDALESERDIGDALVPVGDRMWMAPRGGSFQPHARGMLASTRLKSLVTDMTAHADMVLCDSSPVLLIPDNLFLAAAVDGVILVARAGSTTCRDLARTKALLEGAGARLLGVVINEMPAASLRRHYTRYYATYVKKEGR